ncbi:hypothetical protein V8F33_012301 [Rhypophila sp. PSN 637]
MLTSSSGKLRPFFQPSTIQAITIGLSAYPAVFAHLRKRMRPLPTASPAEDRSGATSGMPATTSGKLRPFVEKPHPFVQLCAIQAIAIGLLGHPAIFARLKKNLKTRPLACPKQEHPGISTGANFLRPLSQRSPTSRLVNFQSGETLVTQSTKTTQFPKPMN